MDPCFSAGEMAAALNVHPAVKGLQVNSTAYGLCPAVTENGRNAAVARVRVTEQGKRYVTITYTCFAPSVLASAAKVDAVLLAATTAAGAGV